MIEKKELIEYLKKINQYLNKNSVDKNFSIVSSLNNQKKNSLSWIYKEDYNLKLLKCDVLLVSKNFQPESNKILIIKVKNPRYAFAKIVKDILIQKEKNYYISSTASIAENVQIGENVIIKDNVVIDKNCVIGNNVIIFPNVTIYKNTEIGNNIIINAGSVIGAAGFGYVKNEKNEYELFPHIGKVILEDNVEIGANTCIDRGGIDETIIRKGVKINNLVHIAHNAVINNNTIIGCNVCICGSVTIGKCSWIAPSVVVRDRINIGENVKIGLGSVVTKSVPDNEIWFGNPAKKRRLNL